MQAHEQESRASSLSLWMDEQAAATAAAELVPPDALDRHLTGQQSAEEVPPPSPTQWAYLHCPVVPVVHGTAGAKA